MSVTIAIPAYNQAEFLPAAIESALGQTRPCDVIVVIDGATDNSEEIARTYPVQVITQVNKGLASARNTAIMSTQTEYFFPLDSDDYLKDNCIEELVKVARETGADVVAPSLQAFGENVGTAILMENPTLEDFRTGNRIPYASLIKTQALRECGGYSPKMDRLGGFEDYHLWHDLLSRGKRIVTIPEPLFCYRTKEDSMWKQTQGKEEQLMEQINNDFPA